MGPVIVDGLAQPRYRYTQTINTKTKCISGGQGSGGSTRPEPAQDTEITCEGGSPPSKMCKVRSMCIGESPSGKTAPSCNPPSQAKLCDSNCNPPVDASGGDANDVTLESPGDIPDWVAPQPPGLDWGSGKLCEVAAAAVAAQVDPCKAMSIKSEITFGDAGHHGQPGGAAPHHQWAAHPMLCPKWEEHGGLDGNPIDRPVTYPGIEPNPPNDIASGGCTDIWIACGHGTQKK